MLLLGLQAAKCTLRDVQTAVGELLPVLIEKASDINPRIKEQVSSQRQGQAVCPQAQRRERLQQPVYGWQLQFTERQEQSVVKSSRAVKVEDNP
jgi:hypothetical protein